MAVVDADYKFLYAQVGAQGRISDGGVLSQSRFGCSLAAAELYVPEPCVITQTNLIMPYMFVADEAFSMTCNITKPYPRRQLTREQRIFNYRLSRARRVVENAFGILTSKFRMYKSPIPLKTSTARVAVMATVCLHNFLRQYNIDNCSDGTEINDDEPASVETENTVLDNNKGLRRLSATKGRINSTAIKQRQDLTNYFMNEGAVAWQYSAAGLDL